MAGSSNNTVLYAAVGSAVLTTLAAAGIAVVVALSAWPAPASESWSTLQLLFSGLCVGVAVGLPIGATLGFHGAVLGSSSAIRAESAPLWGLIAGVLGGASLGPVFAGVMGLAVGYLLDSPAYFVPAAMFGALAGPLLGLFAWQAAYWMADFLRAAHDRSTAS